MDTSQGDPRGILYMMPILILNFIVKNLLKLIKPYLYQGDIENLKSNTIYA